jgi:hypothetical protein
MASGRGRRRGRPGASEAVECPSPRARRGRGAGSRHQRRSSPLCRGPPQGGAGPHLRAGGRPQGAAISRLPTRAFEPADGFRPPGIAGRSARRRDLKPAGRGRADRIIRRQMRCVVLQDPRPNQGPFPALDVPASLRHLAPSAGIGSSGMVGRVRRAPGAAPPAPDRREAALRRRCALLDSHPVRIAMFRERWPDKAARTGTRIARLRATVPAESGASVGCPLRRGQSAALVETRAGGAGRCAARTLASGRRWAKGNASGSQHREPIRPAFGSEPPSSPRHQGRAGCPPEGRGFAPP